MALMKVGKRGSLMVSKTDLSDSKKVEPTVVWMVVKMVVRTDRKVLMMAGMMGWKVDSMVAWMVEQLGH